MMTARVTTIESYRRVMQTEFGDEGELIRAIKGTPDAPNWMMLAGTAWHAVLADPEKHIKCDGNSEEPEYWLESGEWAFDTDALAWAQERLGEGSCEVSGSKVYETRCGPILITGTCDRILGKSIRDAKAKFTTPHAGDYDQSMQWRLYLELFGADQFTYDLFAFSQPKDGFCDLRDIVSFNLFRYVGMESDCERWVRSFVDWADGRGLMAFLHREISDRKVA